MDTNANVKSLAATYRTQRTWSVGISNGTRPCVVQVDHVDNRPYCFGYGTAERLMAPGRLGGGTISTSLHRRDAVIRGAQPIQSKKAP
jgi:hypothetical protein